jgi:hypothetical protein
VLGLLLFAGIAGGDWVGDAVAGAGLASNEGSAHVLTEPSAMGMDARARLLCKNAFWLCPMIRC